MKRPVRKGRIEWPSVRAFAADTGLTYSRARDFATSHGGIADWQLRHVMADLESGRRPLRHGKLFAREFTMQEQMNPER